MFTGISKALGTVAKITVSAAGAECSIASSEIADNLILGESVAVNGTCLTVATLNRPTITFLLTPETLSRTCLSDLSVGDKVNLEPALRVGDSLGGHVVQGHVDATGMVLEQTAVGDSVVIHYEAPLEVLRYLVVKGSIAVDGISLTITEVESRGFAVSLVQYTQKNTNLMSKQHCARVNLEVDLFAKYVERLLQAYE